MNKPNDDREQNTFQQKVDDIEEDIITLLESHKGLLDLKTLYFLIFRYLYLAMAQDGIQEPSKIPLLAMNSASNLLQRKLDNERNI
jgi:hypothetical protein